MKKELTFTRKRLSGCNAFGIVNSFDPRKAIDQYFEDILQFPTRNMPFIDEASVVRTTGNRRYGHAFIGKPAVEICRHSSDANFTVNLLCSMFGIDYYNILEGPSNGLELLQFFEEALEQGYEDGNPILRPGDAVVLDNCGFHHARHVEPIL
ncbi:Hypothetical predicted protein [Paramuricea clavata]|uniref:Uncharacterized protein n=1 Tax=Paramuricea clavata TaxID=317549 RepID=A0A7D9JN27_PARCT|nr:Hypothetical predicted protein [Paramuricea clavata]